MTEHSTTHSNEQAPMLPPGGNGPLTWIKDNLFSTPFSGFLTLSFATVVIWQLSNLLSFAVFNAVWVGDTDTCRANLNGACWPFIVAKLDYFRYGAYPTTERWRVDLAMALGAFLVVWLLWNSAPRRKLAAILFFVVYPVVAFLLLRGFDWLGLPVIDTTLWGGMMITLLMSAVGIVVSLPLGILLALGRASKMPAFRSVCIVYIEVVRGVPFITVLFMANFMMPLFVPEYLTPDRLLRPLIGVSLFSAAYMAEVVRAGLEAVPKGQYEGANALGFGYFKTMRLIVLPQALTVVIPNIVSTFIGLFKDTTLVAIVGIADFLRAVETARIDPNWAGPTISSTGYLFAGLVYWVFCYSMSSYSQSVEKRLERGHKT